jgi:dimethylargininase
MRVFDFDRAIVRRPAADVVEGLRAGDGPAPSFAGIAREHDAYVAALGRAGVDVTILDPLPGFPDAIFVEDPALVFSEGAILLRPGAPSRAREAEHLAPALRDCFSTLLALPEGHADGGDVLVTPDRVYIGLSDRTDQAGAKALQALLARLGRRSVVVRPPPGTLHLKSAAALIAEELVLATAAVAASGLLDGHRILTVPEGEEGGANALRINDVLLAGANYPRTLELLAREGLDVVPLDVSQIARIDAGLTCMSLRWSAAA